MKVKKNQLPEGLDFFHGGKAYGSTASRLLANGMNVEALRTNDVLLYDEWKEIDKVVLASYMYRLVGVQDLLARNLNFSIPNGLGKTVLGYQDASDTTDAEISMDGVTRSKRDRPEFDISYLPLPLIHKDFSFSIREIEASRNGQMALDTTTASLSGRRVAEMIEQILFRGASTYTFGGGTLYGYCDEPNRNTGSLTGGWDDSSTSGEEILDDVLAMKQALVTDRCYGPYGLYIPSNFETKIDADFKANSDKSIRSRLMEISGVLFVKVADKLAVDQVVLVQLTPDVVRMVTGLDITTVQWETDGGMRVNFKVMAIQVPQTRHDQSGRCGIAHYHV
ncbi:MAG: bacteriocin family protein [Gammaproteobacteria bacterium]|nr:bacteriocin family protein [Gammaproteobacteria bacterium]